MSNFDPNAILRGAQLTLVGGRDQRPTTNDQHLLCEQILTRAHSQSCPPEPRTFYIRPLPPSCTRCSCWSSYSHPRIYTCMSIPPGSSRVLRAQLDNGHRELEHFLMVFFNKSMKQCFLYIASTLSYLFGASTDRAALDRWCTGTTMDHFTLRRHEPGYLG